MAFDQSFWEQQWTRAIAQHPDVGDRPPNAHAVSALADLAPGRALDAGCGHGAETLWLAARGWSVVGVDFSTTALGVAASMAEKLGVHDQVGWLQADLSNWSPEADGFDLVLSVYVHAESTKDFVRRLARGVTRGGALFLVGRQGIEQNQVSLAAASAALDGWHFAVADERPGGHVGTDAVILATRP